MFRRFALSCAILVLFCSTVQAEKTFDMRGDEGVMMDFKPTGVEWFSDKLLFVVDEQWNAFHIFDLEGRRFRFVEFPKVKSPAFYAGVDTLEENEFFVTGCHYHKKNRPRYLWQRSVIHRITMEGEEVGEGSVEDNYSPDTGLRKTRLYGASPREQMEISGIAFDKKQKRVFFSLRQPLDEDGNAMIMVGKLDEFLERKKDMELEFLKTELKPPTEPTCKTQFYISDIDYVSGRGLVILLTTQMGEDQTEELKFCSNQIWFMPGGIHKARMLTKELAPGNRATGIALRPVDKWTYEAAVVCNNDPEYTKIPSRLFLIDGLKLKLR